MASATAHEALNTPVPFEYGGLTYEVPPTNLWPYAALEAFEEGKLSGFVRNVLGDEQHDTFKATKPTVQDLSDLIGEMQKALGIAGE